MVGLVSGATAQPVAPMAASTPQPAGGAPASNPGAGAEQMGSTLKNPTLNEIETKIEQSIKPEMMKTYQASVIAAMKLAYDPSTHQLLVKGLQSSDDLSKNISLIVAGMMGTVFEESKMNINAFLPGAMSASITLMCNIIEFAEQSGMVEATPDFIAKTAAATSKAVLNKFGIDDNKVQQAIQKGQSEIDGQGKLPAPQGAAQPPMGA